MCSSLSAITPSNVIDGQCDTEKKAGKIVEGLIKKEQDGKQTKDRNMSRKYVAKTSKKGPFLEVFMT